jgi:predicted ATPase/class 3 adenylate cyclase
VTWSAPWRIIVPVRSDLPSGTVTFLFTDVEGSTRLLHELGPERYAEALDKHRLILREAFRAHGGVEVDTQGDAFFVAFPTAHGALSAARAANESLAEGPIRVRMGIHTGTPHVTEEGYVGADVHRAARIAASGHGGQVLASAATAAFLDTDALRDLGVHRLKDLTAPERISQLGNDDFPPLRTLYQTNLPIPATPFLGRERELSEVTALLARGDVRLVTLTGPGGGGKTRLALHAAGAAAGEFPDGVWWVPLSTLVDASLVVEAAAHALGATVDLAEHIGSKRLLLVFDNFEQVVEAAPEIAALLHACPRVAVLVTSRELLRLEGEWEYAVDPLREEDAIALFEARARAARRDFATTGEVREICARLDSLPLAIELAAARITVLSPSALLKRLERRLPVLAGGKRDAPERQRTLRATIEWSYDMLPPEEQILFRRLSVFAGGAGYDTCEAVCDTGLDALASLVAKSLLRQREDRFWMLETIREYAVERLEDEGEAEGMRRRHADYFLALAEEAEPNLLDDSREWFDRLEREHDNLRAALTGFETTGQSQRALRLAGAIWWFWSVRAYLAEARIRLEAVLRAEERPSAARAKALAGAADVALQLGDAATARRQAEEALALYRELGDARGIAYSVLLLGHAVAEGGDAPEAQELFHETIRLFRDVGDWNQTLVTTRLLAWTYYELGDLDQARALHEENLRRARATRNENIEAQSLGALAEDALAAGRLEEAGSLLREALRINRDLGDLAGTALNFCRLASVLAASGKAETAAQLLSRAEALHEEMGAGVRPWLGEMNEATLASIRAQLDASRVGEAWQRGRDLALDDAVALT